MRLAKIPVILILFLTVLFIQKEPEERFDLDSYDLTLKFREFVPEASSVQKANYISEWSYIYDDEGKEAGKFILSSPYCDDIRGYGGILKLAVIADDEEKIIKTVILNHRETPSWIDGLTKIRFFDSWNGKKLNELKEYRVDAVSGATYTSDAVRKIISRRAAIFTGETEYTISASKSDIKWLNSKYSVVLYLILLFSIIALFVKKLNKYRIYIQISSIIFFGVISGQFISLYFLRNFSVEGISLITSWSTLFLLILSFAIPLFFNKHFYCYYICPFGGIQSVLAKLPVKKLKLNTQTLKALRTVRMLIFFSVIVLILASADINLTLVEPFSVFIFSAASSVTITGSLIIFITSIFIKSPWCLYFCPTGQLFDLLKKGIKK